MIETLKDMKRGKDKYEPSLEKTATQILHHIEDKDSEDSLESTRARVLANARTIYGPTRHLDTLTFAPTSSRKIGAAIVEHCPTGRSYIHCSSAKEETRLGAMEHLLVITEDILQRLIDAEGITSCGWLPNTPAAQQAAISAHVGQGIPGMNGIGVGGNLGGMVMPGSVAGSAAGSVPASRRSSVQPPEGTPTHQPPHQSTHQPPPFPPTHPTIPYSSSEGMFPKPAPPVPLQRNHSDLVYQPQSLQPIARVNSETMHAPKPMPVGRGPGYGRVQWNLGSES
ncbi:hypothetical protein GQ43DRAFT_82708 [Delitschia confertaspora ATCC 74209]|uniref:Uncharacterized protein n=1 Tax=Delitschia confertaspora ATCC 74209 TaxID=1513339 RepID=A0A9P4MRR8_9PLEO|nr:hypothetical protein GQ43DRAFT_82708 [Delitschia confertaspora ATCC 74209]